MKREKKTKNKNINIDEFPCTNCLILPICIERSKPPNKPKERKIPPFLQPLLKHCNLLLKWIQKAPVATRYSTAINITLEFFEKQYEKKE